VFALCDEEADQEGSSTQSWAATIMSVAFVVSRRVRAMWLSWLAIPSR
jgi:hypothetical protein